LLFIYLFIYLLNRHSVRFSGTYREKCFVNIEDGGIEDFGERKKEDKDN